MARHRRWPMLLQVSPWAAPTCWSAKGEYGGWGWRRREKQGQGRRELEVWGEGMGGGEKLACVALCAAPEGGKREQCKDGRKEKG